VEALERREQLAQHLVCGLGGREAVAESRQRLQGRAMPCHGPGRGQQLQLGRRAAGEIREQAEVILAPRARLEVDRAERPNRLAAGAKRHAGIGDHAVLLDGEVGGLPGLHASVLEYVRSVGAEREGAEAGRDRHPAHRGPRFGPAAADEALAIGTDEVHQDDGHVQDSASDPGDPIEGFRRGLGVGLQLREGSQPARPTHHLRHFRGIPRVRHENQRSAAKS
jgi:hypothetical protein